MAKNVVKSKDSEKKPGAVTRFRKFFKDSRAELKKVSWPSREELRKYTGVVLAFIVVFATVIGLMDYGLAALLKLILR